MYFYYYKGMRGNWLPAKTITKPEEKASDGTKRTITNVVELPSEHARYRLRDLELLYPPPEPERQLDLFTPAPRA